MKEKDIEDKKFWLVGVGLAWEVLVVLWEALTRADAFETADKWLGATPITLSVAFAMGLVPIALAIWLERRDKANQNAQSSEDGKIAELWDKYGGAFVFFAVLLTIFSIMFYFAYRWDHTKTYTIGKGVEVRVTQKMVYWKAPRPGITNQFGGSNDLGEADTLEPTFTVHNTATTPRVVNVSNSIDWKYPAARDIKLAPNQSVSFTLPPAEHWWYCWINMVE